MDVSKVDKLNKDFPFLKGYYGNGCAISCGNGWYKIIRETLKKLQEIGMEEYFVTDIKEKWGGLRIYLSSGTDEHYDVIEEAEQKSFEICENCGKKGKTVVRKGWFTTTCDKCDFDHEEN